MRIFTYAADELPEHWITAAFTLTFWDGRLLMANHVNPKRNWDVTGGHREELVEEGRWETPIEAAIRETHEETGWVVKVSRLVGYDELELQSEVDDTYPYPHRGCQPFYLGQPIEWDSDFKRNDETLAGRFLLPGVARNTSWVKKHSGLFELAREQSLALESDLRGGIATAAFSQAL
jgi:8-oxo-dGTP pyrophosphatase MutT (NUDIX family)